MKLKDLDKLLRTNKEHRNQFSKTHSPDAEQLIKDSIKGHKKLGRFKI